MQTKESIVRMGAGYELELSISERERTMDLESKRAIILRQRTTLAVDSTSIAVLLGVLMLVFRRNSKKIQLLNKDLEEKVKIRIKDL